MRGAHRQSGDLGWTDEAAQVLDISTDLVKQRLHRARIALRKILVARLAHTEAAVHG